MLEKLQGKKIAILGMGTNNRKLAEFLNQKQIKYEVIDNWKNADDLVGQLDDFDIIFRTPGLPYKSKAIQQAKAKGVEISSQTKLFFELCPAPIIGITGTKGKGTTSSLIVKILQAAGKNVWFGGNIGTDPFEFIEKIEATDIVVLELSSFQLQDIEQSAHIAVVLSVTPDHLNHHEDFDEYIKAKSSLIAYQKPEDFAILHPGLPDWFKELGQGKKILIDQSNVESYKRKLLGAHNLENIAAASAVAKILKVPQVTIKKAVSEFEPLPHRLEIIAEKKGITFVDDSISTNEDSTIAAINSFSAPLIVILGGSTKGLNYESLGNFIKTKENIKALIVIGEVAPVILKNLDGFTGTILSGAKNMAEIMDDVKSIMTDGDVVLLSPAAASFDMFTSYQDRSEQFIRAVQKV